MSQDNSNTIQQPKNYPATTPQVAKILGLPLSGPHLGDQSLPTQESEAVGEKHFSQIVGNLYVKDGQDAAVAPQEANLNSADAAMENSPLHLLNNNAAATGEPLADNALVRVAKNVAPYVIVFSAGILLYFFFFSKVDFGGMFTGKAQVQTPKQSELAQLERQNLPAYQTWIAQFYFDVSDSSVLDPEADNSGNGLSNFQKYLLNLNPKSYDSLGLGMADSQALQAGINPISGGKLTDAQKAVVDKYFDFEIISNRLAMAHMQKGGQVAGALIGQYPAVVVNPVQQTQNSTQSNTVQPNVLSENNFDFNTAVAAHLDIPSLKVSVPLIWTETAQNFDKDLQNGVVHYPGTAMPGQIGTSYISGHSSNYSWAKGNYNQVFTHLGDLANNTSFSITVPLKTGGNAIFHYVVVGRQEYKPTDQAQFQNTGKSLVALSTCWPVGSTAKRLVVFGELTQVEK